MGLAASQARLLTITSRLSQNEYKQQKLAMSKLVLSADKDNLSLNYSDKLNNQTLTANGKNITIQDLEAMGYSVMRTSDEQKALHKTTETKTYYTKSKPTAPTVPSVAKISKPEAPVNNNEVLRAKYLAKGEKFKTEIQSFVNEYCSGTITAEDFNGSTDGMSHADYIKAYKDAITAGSLEIQENLKEQAPSVNTSALQSQTNTFNNVSITFSNLTGSLKTAANNLSSAVDTTITNVNTYFNSLPADWDKTQAQYQQELAAYNTSKAAWDRYDAQYTQYQNDYQAYLDSAVSKTEEIDENELYTNCKNAQFLIQGLLSGYLALVKDERVVSLDANTDILTEYDKSDDAAAEAQYEAELNKINRKEKAIDLQMRRLETEYTSLTTELNSVQGIVTKHTGSDFQLFS